jgi:uncharacterized membrane protein YjjP (DUF1212 family)
MSWFSPVNSVSVQEIDSERINFKAWPNPSSTWLHVEVSQEVQFEIIDLAGRRVSMGEISPELNAIDVSNLAHGSYTVLITSAESSGSFKLIKQ